MTDCTFKLQLFSFQRVKVNNDKLRQLQLLDERLFLSPAHQKQGQLVERRERRREKRYYIRSSETKTDAAATTTTTTSVSY